METLSKAYWSVGLLVLHRWVDPEFEDEDDVRREVEAPHRVIVDVEMEERRE